MTILINSFLRQYIGGEKTIAVKGKTVGDCLDDLEGRFPGIKKQLYDKEGELADLWDVYVNSKLLS